ncbi:MAG: anti-sigma factor [Granulosicoccus sp.]
MNSPDERWWSVRAGEYVLGTLRGKDLELFERILAHDTSIQAEVARWEQQLTGLNETPREFVPGEHVLPQILQRVRSLNDEGADTNPDSAPDSISVESKNTGDNQSEQRVMKPGAPVRKFQVWPTLAGLATAASLVLGLLLVQQTTKQTTLPLSVDGLAVVLSDEDGKPFFLVETDYGNLRVRVTALAPPSLDESRDFQLWQALPDRSSVRPVALLPEEPGTSRTFHVDSLIDGSDLFGVSIEPVGALTTSGPTGPVVAHGDFLPKRNID